LRKRYGAALAALVVITVAFLVVFHNGAVRFALSNIVGLTTGYWVSIGDLHFGSHHGALADVHVTRGGEPVLDARRIDLYYDPRDLLPGSRHRFGLHSITIDRPQITIVHHENGTYNIAIPREVSGGTRVPRGPNPVPIDFTIRVRDASMALVDEYRYYKESRRQRLDGVNADVAIDTAKVTKYLVTGKLEDAGPQPFRMAGTIDYVNGYALHHIQVRAIPIATIGNYFINSPAAHILAGTVRNMDLHAWAFNVAPGTPAAYHMSGAGYLDGGQIYVQSLDSPIKNLSGGINIFDSGFAARRLTATVGHLSIACAGGIFDFRSPQFRLGVEGSGDLRNLKDVLKVAGGLPIFGGVRIHALIEGGIGDPVLLIAFDGSRFNYGAVPIDTPRGTVALYRGNLIVLPFHASYSGIGLHIQGNLQLGKNVNSVLTLHAIGNSERIPYLGALIAPQPMLIETLIHGTDLKIDARGYLVSLQDARNASGFYDLNRYGVGTFGPIGITTPAGGTLVAGFSLDRPHGGSTFWVSARNVRLNQPKPVSLPGTNIPQLPPMDAHILEANMAGTGSASNVVIGGSAYMSPATIAGVPFTTIAARFAGPFAASRLSTVHADGPWGTFDGGGTFAPNLIVARGNYEGTFQGLHAFLGGFPAQGAISGPMAIAIAQSKIFVQAQNAHLSHATIHGIPISSITGTMSFDNGILRVYSAQARAAGGTVVAAGSFATTPSSTPTRLALATTQLDAGSLHGFGAPIGSGSLRAVGAVAPGGAIPNVDAGVVLTGGTAAGYGPFNTSTEISIANDAMHVRDTVASLGPTFAYVDGSLANLAAGVPSYDIAANVPVGEIAPMAQLVKIPTYHLDGSFQGSVRITGSGLNPHVIGSVAVPVGEINGLGFRDAQAQISASPGGASIRAASVTVGSTVAKFSATVTKDELAFAMRSPHADLSDFNDYFDTGDTLAGNGLVALSFAHFNHLTFSAGDLDIKGLRYRRLPIGDTDADWTSLRNVTKGNVAIGGDHGRLSASGTIGFAPSPNIAQIVTHSRYNITASLTNLDLTTWLPALGFPQLPVTGRINGDASVRGAYPHLAITGNASIHDGTIGPLPIETGEVWAHSAPGDRIDVTRLVFALPALQASGSGSFGIRPNAPMNLQVHAVTDDMPRLIAQVSKKRVDLRGHIESTISIGGSFRSPTFAAGVDASNVSAFGVQIPSFVGQLQLHRRDLVVRNAEFVFPKGRATIAGFLPLTLQPFAFGPLKAPIAMDMTADDVDLSTFASFLGNGTKLGGTLNGHIGVSGSVRDPRIFGQLAATDASYASNLEITPITHTVAQITFEGTKASFDRVHAQIGRGRLDGSGSLNFGGGLNGGPLGYAISLVTRGAQLDMPAFGTGTFDSALSLQRTPGQLALLKGNVTVSDAVMPFATFLKFGGSGPGQSAGPPFNLAFDLGITAGRNVRVRGGGAGVFGLDISGEGHAQLSGTLLRPTLSGQFNSAGGSLVYIDHSFKVETGRVTFDPRNGVIPDVYAVATTHVTNPDPNTSRNPTGSADITATVTGPVTSPRIAFTSNPAGYTDQQIIALLLPLGGLVGPIQFTDTGVILPAGQLAGAPEPGTGAILPNILVRRENGTLTIGQEAFNILNAQFTSGILAPVESALSNTLGLSDVNLTVDYTGSFGVSLRRLLASNFYALYGTTFTVPVRQTFGFAYQPNAFTSSQFTMFVQQGPTPLFLGPNQTLSTNPRASAGQALQGQNGFTFLFQRLF
jgi:hypothetical protein